jgi:hypothetical protein
VIGIAAADLFAALPRPIREEMSELPAVVAQLERHAGEIRVRVTTLDDAIAGVGAARGDALFAAREQTHAELCAARDAAQARLAEAVAALETIRLTLLRVHAGRANRPAAALTEAVEAAHRLASDLSARADAAEAERLFDGRERRPVTPAALPAVRRSTTPAS